MKCHYLTQRTVAGVLVAFAFCCPARTLAAAPAETQSSAEQQLLAAAGEGFELLRSDHFALAYNADDRLARSLIRRLEATYEDVGRFCATLGLPHTPPPTRLEVILFADPGEFRAYAERVGYDHRGSFGFYHARSNRSAFFDSSADPELTPAREQLAKLERDIAAYRTALRTSPTSSETVEVSIEGEPSCTMARNEAVAKLAELRRTVREQTTNLRLYNRQANQMVIQHEGSHQVLFNVGVHERDARNPQWLMEGLACLFEPPPVSGEPGLAGVNQFRLYDLRKALDLPPADRTISDAQIEEAIAGGRFIPLRQLVGDPGVFDSRPDGVWPAYAEAWALVHYLYTERPDDLARYIKRVAARPSDLTPTPESEVADFTAVFGPPDEAFRRQWLDAILRLPAPTAKAQLK